MRRPHAVLALALATVAAIAPAVARAQIDETVHPAVPQVFTPKAVVDRMLEIAKVGPADVVYDLGCGDGRIVLAAAKRYGARGVGVDLDRELVDRANAAAREAGLGDRARFVTGDLYRFDFREATVVTLYLLPQVNREIRPLLWKQLAVGSRVVSHQWDMGADWPPDAVDHVDGHAIYSWTIRATHK